MLKLRVTKGRAPFGSILSQILNEFFDGVLNKKNLFPFGVVRFNNDLENIL